MHLLGCFPFGFEQLRDGFISPPGLGQPWGHVNEVQGAALPGQGAHGTLVRLLNGDEFEGPRVELATTLVVRDSTARLG
ncbi:hypothetical protein AB5J49_15035 [Streptomyces sp. R28]|uniref:Uncharacterized protein n=1 Tax=Streptomyces sp. R28 TaxID=3238628 RepID=A0AB39PX68_9ACTN